MNVYMSLSMSMLFQESETVSAGDDTKSKLFEGVRYDFQRVKRWLKRFQDTAGGTMRTGERKEVNIVEKRLLFIPQSA